MHSQASRVSCPVLCRVWTGTYLPGRPSHLKASTVVSPCSRLLVVKNERFLAIRRDPGLRSSRLGCSPQDAHFTPQCHNGKARSQGLAPSPRGLLRLLAACPPGSLKLYSCQDRHRLSTTYNMTVAQHVVWRSGIAVPVNLWRNRKMAEAHHTSHVGPLRALHRSMSSWQHPSATRHPAPSQLVHSSSKARPAPPAPRRGLMHRGAETPKQVRWRPSICQPIRRGASDKQRYMSH